MKCLVLVASCLLLASPALAQESSGEQTDRTPSSQSGATAGGTVSADDRVICRRIEADTGTRMGSRRVCMTRRDWREYDRQN